MASSNNSQEKVGEDQFYEMVNHVKCTLDEVTAQIKEVEKLGNPHSCSFYRGVVRECIDALNGAADLFNGSCRHCKAVKHTFPWYISQHLRLAIDFLSAHLPSLGKPCCCEHYHVSFSEQQRRTDEIYSIGEEIKLPEKKKDEQTFTSLELVEHFCMQEDPDALIKILTETGQEFVFEKESRLDLKLVRFHTALASRVISAGLFLYEYPPKFMGTYRGTSWTVRIVKGITLAFTEYPYKIHDEAYKGLLDSNMLKDRNTNKVDPMGRTPLLFAVLGSQIASVQHLLKGGASPNMADHDGVTPLHLALVQGNTKIIDLLMKHNVSWTGNCEDFLTPLYCATFCWALTRNLLMSLGKKDSDASTSK